MIINVFISSSNISLSTPVADGNTINAVRLEMEDHNVLNKYLSKDASDKFILFMDSKVLLDNFTSFCHLFFSMNYYFINDKPLLFIYGSTDESCLKNLNDQIKLQGYGGFCFFELKKTFDGLICVDIYEHIVAQKKIESTKDLSEFLRPRIHKDILVICSEGSHASNLDSVKNVMDNTLQSTPFFEYYDQFEKTRRENEDTLNELKWIRAQLSNYETHLKLIKDSYNHDLEWYRKEIEAIKSWYENRYGSLPSWMLKVNKAFNLLKK